MNAKHLVVCLSVVGLALMSSAGRADVIQIDDLDESLVVTFTSTGGGSLGTVTNTDESVIISHILVGCIWGCTEKGVVGVVTVTLKGQARPRTHAS